MASDGVERRDISEIRVLHRRGVWRIVSLGRSA